MVGKSKKLEAYMEVFQNIAKTENVQADCFLGSLQSIIENIAEKLEVSRVSVWEYSVKDNIDYIECIAELKSDKMNYLNVKLDSESFPSYFEAIKTEEIVVANDARKNPATSCFLSTLLIPLNIYSMLDVPYFMEGKLKGVICLEHQDEYREWCVEDQFFARVMSSFISISYKNSRIFEDNKRIEKINEELIKSRNTLIQTEKVAALGQVFSGVAHDINTPLGAIKAASENVAFSFEKLPLQIYGFVNQYSKKEFEMILEMCKRRESKYKNRKEIRDSRKRIQVILDINHVGVAGLSDVLAQLQIETFKNEEITFFKSCDDSLVKFLYLLSDIGTNVNVINQAVDKTSVIINSLKSFIRTGEKEDCVAFSLQDSIDSVLNIYANFLKNIDFKLNVPEKKILLEGRKNDFIQIFTNVLYNAIQASDYSGEIIFKVETDDCRVVISIKDFGSGIKEEIIHKIFDPLFTTKSEGEGSGIGLDIVKRLVESYRGDISVKSEVSVGSEFVITLPCYSNK